MKRLFIFLTITLLLMSCKTTTIEVEKEVPVPVVKIEYRDKLIYDSIYIHDSINTFIKGDTIIKERIKNSTKYINRTDTFIKTDTISIPVKIKEKEVVYVNKLKWYQQDLMYLGLFSLGFILVSIFKSKL